MGWPAEVTAGCFVTGSNLAVTGRTPRGANLRHCRSHDAAPLLEKAALSYKLQGEEAEVKKHTRKFKQPESNGNFKGGLGLVIVSVYGLTCIKQGHSGQ